MSSQDKNNGEFINVKVRSNAGDEVYFKIKKGTQLKKLITTYCARESLVPANVRFIYEGKRIQPTDTPQSLEMEDGDLIDAELEQIGGAY